MTTPKNDNNIIPVETIRDAAARQAAFGRVRKLYDEKFGAERSRLDQQKAGLRQRFDTDSAQLDRMHADINAAESRARQLLEQQADVMESQLRAEFARAVHEALEKAGIGDLLRELHARGLNELGEAPASALVRAGLRDAVPITLEGPVEPPRLRRFVFWHDDDPQVNPAEGVPLPELPKLGARG